VLVAGGVHIDSWIAIVRAKGIFQHAGTLVAEIVFAVVERSEPFAAFEQDNTKAGCGEFFGDYAAAGATAYDCRVDVSQRHPLNRTHGLHRGLHSSAVAG
jgi:hypothetical protein